MPRDKVVEQNGTNVGSVNMYQRQVEHTSAAMHRYQDRVDQDTEILDLRVMHRNAMRRINTRLKQIDKELGAIDTRKREREKAKLKAAASADVPPAKAAERGDTNEQTAAAAPSSAAPVETTPEEEREQPQAAPEEEQTPAASEEQHPAASTETTAAPSEAADPSPPTESEPVNAETQKSNDAADTSNPNDDEGAQEAATSVETTEAAAAQEEGAGEGRDADSAPPTIATSTAPAPAEATTSAEEEDQARFETLCKEATQLHTERDDRHDAFLAQIKYLSGQLTKLDEEESGLVRGVLAERGIVDMRNKDRQGRALREHWKGEPQRFCDAFFTFFDEHGQKQYEELRHREVEALKDLFASADANETTLVERFDLEGVMKKLYRKTGLTQLGMTQQMLLLGFEPLEQMALSMTNFFKLGCKLAPLAAKTSSDIAKANALKDKKELSNRRKLVATYENAWDQLETRYRTSIAKLEMRIHSESANEGLKKDLASEKAARREARMDWAAAAVVATTAEDEAKRNSKLLSFTDRHPFDNVSAYDKMRADRSEKTSVVGTVNGPRRPRPPPPSAVVEESKRHLAIRAAFDRAPVYVKPDELTSDQMDDLRELFGVLSGGAELIGPTDVASLLSLYWPSGAEVEDGAAFLQLCNGGAPLPFERFVANAGNLSSWTRAEAGFHSLDDQGKLSHVSQKREAGLHLARFERTTERSILNMRRPVRPPQPGRGTSSFLSDRGYLQPHGRSFSSTARSASGSPRNDETLAWENSPSNSNNDTLRRHDDDDSPRVQPQPASPPRTAHSARTSRSRGGSARVPLTPRCTVSMPRLPRLPHSNNVLSSTESRLYPIADYRRGQDERFCQLLRVVHGLNELY